MMGALELYERRDLAELIRGHEAHFTRLARRLESREIDSAAFARHTTATRLTLLALREALAIQRGDVERTDRYRHFCSQAAVAIQLAEALDTLDDDLQSLLGGAG